MAAFAGGCGYSRRALLHAADKLFHFGTNAAMRWYENNSERQPGR